MALGKTVRQLLHEMDAAELAEWQVYDRIEPIGDERADLRAGILAATVAAPHSKTPVTPSSFIPNFWKKRQTAAEQQEIARRIAARYAKLPEPNGNNR